jgi:hypothetical protein
MINKIINMQINDMNMISIAYVNQISTSPAVPEPALKI